PARIAGLAALLFVLDDAHGFTVGWISARNTLLATIFAVACVLVHVRMPRSGSARVLGPLLLALALASGEAGVTALAVLAAHALLRESGSVRARLLMLLPYACVTAAWAAVYVVGGYGAHNAGAYRDVAGAPVQTLIAGLADTPVLLFSQLGVSFVGPLLAAPD